MKNNRFDLVPLAKEWSETFLSLLEKKKVHPIAPYQPSRAYKKRRVKETRLNIAAGPNVFPFDGWINLDNTDFAQYFNFVQTVPTSHGMPDHQVKLWQFCQDGGKIEYQQHDMTKPFTQFADSSVDGIYVGQAIEHLSPVHQVPAFLKECHRMLKPGAVLRMTTPDLEILLEAFRKNELDKFSDDQPAFYKDACPSMQLSYLMFGAGGPDCTQTHYEGHMVCFTRTSLSKELEKAGFKKIVFYNRAGESLDSVMAEQVKDEGLTHSLIVEAVK